MRYDICIIGGGPGGYSAAIRGAQLGAKVALIEKESLGGTCLNHGCIPTKNLYSTSEMVRSLGEAGKFGINDIAYNFDFSMAISRKNEVVEHLRRGLQRLFKDHKIDILSGRGSLEREGQVRVETPGEVKIVETVKIIIATGSEAADLPSLRMDGRRVIGNREMLNLSEVPPRLLIVGGGAIGCEFANIFSRIGSKVIILERMESILPDCEREISRVVKKRFGERGIEVITGQSVVSAASGETGERGVKVTISDGSDINADKVLLAVGRRLNSFGLNLEEMGVEMDGNTIKVNKMMETSLTGVYAVGDVTGNMQLAHVAAQEGKVAAANAMGGNSEMDYSVVPWAIFIHPEVASVGKGEKGIKESGVPYNVGRFPYLANGKAVAMGEEDGFVKVLTSRDDGRALGVHILGAHASDLIAEAALAMKMGCTMKEIADTIHAHPTLSEALLEAWEDTEGMAIHKAGKRLI